MHETVVATIELKSAFEPQWIGNCRRIRSRPCMSPEITPMFVPSGVARMYVAFSKPLWSDHLPYTAALEMDRQVFGNAAGYISIVGLQVACALRLSMRNPSIWVKILI